MRTPVDTEATRALIAKIKKCDAENAKAIAENADAIKGLQRCALDVNFDSDELVFTKGRTVING